MSAHTFNNAGFYKEKQPIYDCCITEYTEFLLTRNKVK